MTNRETARNEAIAALREIIKPGDTVYTILKHVSRSGMQRAIDVHIIRDNEPQWIAHTVARAIEFSFDEKRECLRVGGCGMDMGFHVVHSLSYALYGREHGYQCLGKGKCPSNYHSNHRDNVHCHGSEGEDSVPCFSDDKGVYRLRTGVGENFGLGAICPTCKGKGSYPNPEGKERFDLKHTDGYALKQRWM